MLKRFCDRCGESAENNECISFRLKRVDLCEKCVSDLKEFLTPDEVKLKTVISSTEIVCEKCGQPMKTGYYIQENGKFMKVCRGCCPSYGRNR